MLLLGHRKIIRAIMIVICEIFLAALLSATLYMIWRASAQSLCKGVLLYFIAAITGFICFKSALWLGALLFSNIFTQLLTGLFFTLVLSLFIVQRSHLHIKACFIHFFEKYQRLIKVTFVIALMLISAVLCISITNLLSADEQLHQELKYNSLYCHFFLSETQTEDTNKPWQKVKSAIVRHSGSKNVADNMKALLFILSLKTSEYESLAERNELLQKAFKEPMILDIIKDDQLMGIFAKGDFSFSKVYRLGGNQKIKKLLDNKEFITLIRQIDLQELENDARRHRRSLLQELKPQWSQSSINHTLELDQCLQSGSWKPCNPDNIRFAKVPCCLLRSEISKQGHIIINCKTNSAPVLLVNDVSRKMKVNGDLYSLELENNGQLELVFMFFSPKGGPYHCSVATYCKDGD